MKYSEKKTNSLKKGDGVLLLNFEGGPGSQGSKVKLLHHAWIIKSLFHSSVLSF